MRILQGAANAATVWIILEGRSAVTGTESCSVSLMREKPYLESL